jgi:hypothetical protein
MQQRLEPMLGLALHFPLLGRPDRSTRIPCPLKCHNLGQLWAWMEPLKDLSGLHLPPKRPMQQRLKQMLRLALRFALLGSHSTGMKRRQLFRWTAPDTGGRLLTRPARAGTTLHLRMLAYLYVKERHPFL